MFMHCLKLLPTLLEVFVVFMFFVAVTAVWFLHIMLTGSPYHGRLSWCGGGASCTDDPKVF